MLTAEAVAAGKRRFAVVILLLLASVMAYTPYAESDWLLLTLIGVSVACVNSVFTMQWSLTSDLLRSSGSDCSRPCRGMRIWYSVFPA